MGMAASQVRLLALTSRLHDVEYKAQSIMSEKLALSTQKDALYRDYCDALDATKITVAYMGADGKSKYLDANYTTLCSYNENRMKQYALKDNLTGLLITTQDVKDTYEDFDTDKYAFAYAMMGFDGSFGWDGNEGMGAEIGIGTAQDDYGIYSEGGTGFSLYMTDCEQNVFDTKCSGDTSLQNKYDAIEKAEGDDAKQVALEEFREYLYSKYSNDIYNEMIKDKQTWDGDPEAIPTDDRTWEEISGEFNYYVRLWEAIDQAGGCKVIDPEFESGEKGDVWFNNMVNAAMISILVWDDTGSNKEWSETSVATSTNNNYLQEVQDDKDLKKAEAEYEHQLDIINRKDTRFDTELSKLETERNAITTEMDSIKTVKKDNIDRTFGIFG